jgi:uncharacterized membrane protein YeaQ/YmgE (transglycosylase-associated protein family)
MDVLGWLILGFLAGWLSGLVVPGRTARGCLPNILVGILGAVVGGYLARELGWGDPSGFIGALVVAFVGAVVVRFLIGLIDGDRAR